MGEGILRREEKGGNSMKKKEKHLKPVGLVVISESVMEKQTNEVQELLKKLNALKERTSSEGAKIRKALRKMGFKLSDFRKRSPEVKK